MSHALRELIDEGDARLYLVATQPLWIGAVKRAAQHGGPGKQLRVEEVDGLAHLPPAKRAGCQLVFVEVTRSRVAEVVAWLTAGWPLASVSHVVAMVSHAERDFSASELGSAVQWLHEAGASHVVTSVWGLAEVFEVMERVAFKSLETDPWERLPLPLEAEGWQPHHRGDRF